VEVNKPGGAVHIVRRESIAPLGAAGMQRRVTPAAEWSYCVTSV
jgi:hypothetical protein